MSESNKMSYEESIKRLEEIIEKMEADEVGLEESVALFQEGINLSAECSELLNGVEEKISILMEQNGKTTTKEIVESELRD